MKKELIHNLVKVLEKMEDEIVFTVFYPFSRFLESHHFTPAWDFDAYYYEIQYDDSDELQVLRWHPRANDDSPGYILNEQEITQLTKEIVEFWADGVLKRSAEKELKKEENIKQMISSDGWQHFLKGDIITSDFDEDVEYSIRTENLTPDKIIERYKGLLSEKEIKDLKL